MLPADTERDPQARLRFRREALAAAALDHPFICQIHEVGEDGGRSFLVLEYIEGRTLTLSGSLDVSSGDATHRLKAGETARYAVDVAHAIVNPTRTAATALLVVLHR